ncbi:MAG: hypothetical protein ABJK37_08110 [Paraglaciecola sp.]|uniref:hypothetical protein n=1 Tax=Paraglaciecola sp. TaxID=1920173 RepID=UPI0032996468
MINYARKYKIIVMLLLVASSSCFAGMDEQELAIAKAIMDRSGINATKSISLVLQQYKGIVYDYELDTDDSDDDALIHQIKLIDLETDVKHKITVSALDGSIVEIEEESLFSWFYEDDSVKAVKKLQKLNYSLVEAMTTISLPSDGIFYDVELEDKQGVVYFELEMFSSQGEQELLVDAASRKIIPVFQR